MRGNGKAMNKRLRAVLVFGMAFLFSDVCLMQAQQHQSETLVYSDGEKLVVDTNTGMTVVDKNGNDGTNLTADQARGTCEENDKQTAPSPALTLFALPCEIWAELQPHTQIERLPFLNFIARLLVATPPSTDFARYRGLELQSTKEGKAYDATILPNDAGNNVSCTIKEGTLSDRVLYLYDCTIKTSSYQDAIQLQEHLVQLLGPLKLTEDQVEEHGVAARTVSEGRCAALTGECEGQHLYATTEQDGKALHIEANPDFTRTAEETILSLQTGHELVSRISPNSATVSIEVFSVGPKNADDVTEGKPDSQSNPQ
jgi:hypothetical protein